MKKVLSLILAAALALFMAAGSAAESIHLRYAELDVGENLLTVDARYFADRVKELSDGRIIIDIYDILDRFTEIHENYKEYRWTYTYQLILEYYGLETLTEEDAERIHSDYITARRKWISEIRKDAEKEFSLGDVERDVLNEFITQLEDEVDFENQKLYM